MNEKVETGNTDFLIRVINGKEYKLKLKYSNQKYMISRFGISTTDFAQFDKHLGQILYSCITNDEMVEGKRGTFEEFEKSLDNETLEYLIEIIEDIMKISFPDKYKEVEHNQNENNENEDTKKK